MGSNAVPIDVDANRAGPVWVTTGWFLAVLLTCTLALSSPVADPDLWGHVQFGRDLLAGGLPRTTTYSYTAPGCPWINHENLSELLLAWGADTIGPSGLLAGKCLVGLAVIGLIAATAWRAGVGFFATSIMALLVSVNLLFYWQLRPQILSCALFALLIAVLSTCFQGWEGRWQLPWFRRAARDEGPLDIEYSSRRIRCLWACPVILALWANTHGAFLAGLAIFIAYIGCRAVEAVAAHQLQAAGMLRRFAMMAVVGVLATLINPYSFRLHQWLLESLSMPRPEVTEWHPISLDSQIAVPFAVLLAVTVVVLAGSRRPLDATQLGLLTLTAWQAVSHQRHVPFLAIMVGFWLPIHVQSLLQRLGTSPSTKSLPADSPPRMKWLTAAAIGCVCTLLCAVLLGRMGEVSVDKGRFPVKALQFMADHKMSGRLVVTYNWAQYAIAAMDSYTPDKTGVQVAFDGRFRTCYPQQIVDQHFDFILGHDIDRFRSPDSPAADARRILGFKNPELVLISRYQEHSVEVMKRSRDAWTLLYQDQLAQLWGLRTKYDEPSSPDYLPPGRRCITDEPQMGAVSWPALPRPIRRLGRIAESSAAPTRKSGGVKRSSRRGV